MADIVVILLIVCAIGLAIKTLHSKKKKGCIGCPYCQDGVCHSKTK